MLLAHIEASTPVIIKHLLRTLQRERTRLTREEGQSGVEIELKLGGLTEDQGAFLHH